MILGLQIYSRSFHPQMDCINSCSATNSFEAITAAETMIKIFAIPSPICQKDSLLWENHIYGTAAEETLAQHFEGNRYLSSGQIKTNLTTVSVVITLWALLSKYETIYHENLPIVYKQRSNMSRESFATAQLSVPSRSVISFLVCTESKMVGQSCFRCQSSTTQDASPNTIFEP